MVCSAFISVGCASVGGWALFRSLTFNFRCKNHQGTLHYRLVDKNECPRSDTHHFRIERQRLDREKADGMSNKEKIPLTSYHSARAVSLVLIIYLNSKRTNTYRTWSWNEIYAGWNFQRMESEKNQLTRTSDAAMVTSRRWLGSSAYWCRPIERNDISEENIYIDGGREHQERRNWKWLLARRSWPLTSD